jgi:hypothetical protein
MSRVGVLLGFEEAGGTVCSAGFGRPRQSGEYSVCSILVNVVECCDQLAVWSGRELRAMIRFEAARRKTWKPYQIS